MSVTLSEVTLSEAEGSGSEGVGRRCLAIVDSSAALRITMALRRPRETMKCGRLSTVAPAQAGVQGRGPVSYSRPD